MTVVTASGKQIMEQIARKRPELAVLGKATGGTTTTCIDTQRLRGDTLPVDYFGGDAWIYFLSGSNAGFEGKIDQLAGSSGTLTFSPAASNPVASGDEYIVLRHGLRVDAWQHARDRALTKRCSMWRPKPLSMLTDVEAWTILLGDETLATQALDFPTQFVAQAARVTNASANGGLSSEQLNVQPNQSYRLAGRVSVRSGTAILRARDRSGNADITLSGTSQFTKLGWQRFDTTFTIPSGCEKLQIWPTGSESSAIVDWAAISLLPLDATRFNLQSRVLSDTEIGRIYGWRGPNDNPRRPEWVRLTADRHRSASLGELVFDSPPGAFSEVWYEEQHHYAALQTDYFATSDRTTGDAATTDCAIEYVAAATVVELLENQAQDPVLNKTYLAAEKDLGFWDRKVGAPAIVIDETVPPARVLSMRLR